MKCKITFEPIRNFLQGDICVGSADHQQQQQGNHHQTEGLKLSPSSSSSSGQQQGNCDGGGGSGNVITLNGHVDYGGQPGGPVAIPVSIHGGPMVLHGHP